MEVFEVLLRFMTRRNYSLHTHILGQAGRPKCPFLWVQIAVFALHIRELSLEVFVRADNYGCERACQQMVADLSNVLAIFHSAVYITWPNMFNGSDPLVVEAHLFHKIHNDHGLLRF